MANVKNGAFREIIIDRCLQSRKGYSTQELLEKCNNALERRGETLVTSLNTIRNDILSIENRWHIVVESIKDGRNVRYRYQNPSFSIFNSPLNEDEITQLTQAVSLLHRFEGMPEFAWVEELSVHLQTTINATSTPIVGFDENLQLKGKEFFTAIFNYISNKQPIQIIYTTYRTKVVSDFLVHPYYLKEYNQRWFLFALNDKTKQITTFALDRIEMIKKVSVKFIESRILNFETYFDDIVGVSKNPYLGVEEITLLVDKEQLPYILSKPIHKSQYFVKEMEDGCSIITIRVQPNFELIQLFLSFGDRVTILSPNHIREEIKARIKKSFENYQ